MENGNSDTNEYFRETKIVPNGILGKHELCQIVLCRNKN